MTADNNNEELRSLLKSEALTIQDIAQLLNLPFDSVRNWTRSPSSAHYRKMSNTASELLKIKIKDRKNDS